MILYKEGATQAQEDEANAILEVLEFAYPDHPWGVVVREGGFFIKHLAFPKNWGMACRAKDVDWSSSHMKAQIIRMAGEWLERAGLPRRRYDPEQEIVRLEGIPEKDQPHQKLGNYEIEIEQPDDSNGFVIRDAAHRTH